MDFGFTSEQQVLRAEMRAFLNGPMVQGLLADQRALPPRASQHSPELYNLLAERGWLALHWPTEYGGGGKSEIEAGIFIEEAARAGVPLMVYGLTISIFGAFLFLAGTEAQKRMLLPPIARGELICNILYTEPDAGSDLAALTTRAVADGDEFVITGTKIFNSVGHLASYGLIAARTDPGAGRYQGITLFLAPMRDPRVQVNPLWTMSDEHFNEVVLDGLRVPRENIVGALNGGWALLNQALAVERNGLVIAAEAAHWLDLLIDHIRSCGRGADPIVWQRVAQLAAEVAAARLLAWRVVALQAHGQVDDVRSAMSKWYAGELCKRLTHVAGEIMGLAGTLDRFDAAAPLGGQLEAAHRWAPAWGIAAGTSEIMLYLIAQRALGAGK
ncbi:MAG TPA: acyl-CoA dehydrogenase family protein [Roseiflexaceae bacterium]|nr:acyl-CoA dehydrogenase family protein [Roseiflexaceae bacterium]